VRRVERNPRGQLWNVPIATYQDVDQFWSYDPETYMRQPSYSRAFQGVR
jgi:branched-chain amino acid transport system substrate-binding protein